MIQDAKKSDLGKTRKWSITADKFLSQEQVRLLLNFIARERDLAIARGNNSQAVKDYYIVRGLLETGCRVQEFCDLKNSDFIGLKLNIRRGKGGRPRTVLLTRATGNLFKEWLTVKGIIGFNNLPGGALFPSRYRTHYSVRGIQDRIKITYRAASLPIHFSVHSLRHTYCSLLLASKKVDLPTARDNMGHHSISVTNLYSHALGNLDDVDLYSGSTVENLEKDEVETTPNRKNSNDLVKQFLRKAQLK